MSIFRQALRELLRSITANEPSGAPGHISRREAETRGNQLLMDNLSQEQRAQYVKGGYIEVIGGDTGKRYRIRHGSQMNVEELDLQGRRVHLFCFMPEGRVPIADTMLAQKMALELFEREAIGIANRFPMWNHDFADELHFARRYARRL
jgi:hypothetical protein